MLRMERSVKRFGHLRPYLSCWRIRASSIVAIEDPSGSRLGIRMARHGIFRGLASFGRSRARDGKSYSARRASTGFTEAARRAGR
jgi:hypothetical protein